MWKDPIVEELHALREKMTQAVGGDMRRYAQQLRESAKKRQDTAHFSQLSAGFSSPSTNEATPLVG